MPDCLNRRSRRIRLRHHPRGRQFDDPSGAAAHLRMEQSRTLNRPAPATAPWLPPGGSCHDEISALRNRYFVVTDEGWRGLKVSDFLVKWSKPEHMPLIQLHSFTNLSPPLIRLFCQSVPKFRLSKNPASPRGKPRTQKILACTIHRTALLRGRRGDPQFSPLPCRCRRRWQRLPHPQPPR